MCKIYILSRSKKIECAWISQDRKAASRLEYYIKKLPKQAKEDLINKSITITDATGGRLDKDIYERVSSKF